MITIEVEFHGHCEDDCGLGSAHYICPKCNQNQTDYGKLWYSNEEDAGHISKVSCEDCNYTFTLEKLEYNLYKLKEDEDN